MFAMPDALDFLNHKTSTTSVSILTKIKLLKPRLGRLKYQGYKNIRSEKND